MKKAATIFLRFALVIMALAMIGICVGASWVIIGDGGFGSEHRYLGYLFLAVIYTAVLPYFITLFQSAKLLGFIDNELAFSEQSVKALTIIIKSSLAVFIICTVGGLPFFYQIAIIEDAPGMMVIGLVIAGVALTISVFAYVLRWLVNEAIGYKTRCEEK